MVGVPEPRQREAQVVARVVAFGIHGDSPLECRHGVAEAPELAIGLPRDFVAFGVVRLVAEVVAQIGQALAHLVQDEKGLRE